MPLHRTAPLHSHLPHATPTGLTCNRYHDEFNAVHVAPTPTLDALKATAPRRWRCLRAHGTAVGLPSDADMGNSEAS